MRRNTIAATASQAFQRAATPAGIISLLAALAAGLVIARLPLGQLEILCAAMVALIVVAVILTEPAIGIACTLFASPFGPLENITLHLPIESGQALLLLTLAALVVRALYQRRANLRAGPLLWPLMLFLGVGGLSFLVATSFELWAKECLKWAEVIVVYIVAVSEVKANPRARAILLAGILVSTLFEAALGIYQFGLRGTGPQEFAIVVNRYYRSYGTFEQPNPFGGYMGLTWPLAAALALTFIPQAIRLLAQPAARFSPPAIRLYALIAVQGLTAILALVALVLSWSRGAWLAAGACALVMLIAAIRKPLASLAVLALLVLLVFGLNLTSLLPASLVGRLTNFTQEFTSFDVRGVVIDTTNYSVIERLAHWQAAENMIAANPFLGVGFGNYAAVYDQYRTLNWPIALGHAHNYYLNIFAETGAVGLLAYLILWGCIFIRTLKGLNRSRQLAGFALGLLGAWVSLSVHQIVDNLYVANIYLLIGIYLGLLDGFNWHKTESSH